MLTNSKELENILSNHFFYTFVFVWFHVITLTGVHFLLQTQAFFSALLQIPLNYWAMLLFNMNMYRKKLRSATTNMVFEHYFFDPLFNTVIVIRLLCYIVFQLYRNCNWSHCACACVRNHEIICGIDVL